MKSNYFFSEDSNKPKDLKNNLIDIDSKKNSGFLIITVLFKQPIGCSSTSDHIAAVIDDPQIINQEKTINEKGRYVVNYGLYDNSLGNGDGEGEGGGIMQRLKSYPEEYRAQFLVEKNNKHNIDAFIAFHTQKSYNSDYYDYDDFNPLHNCADAVKVTLEYFAEEPLARIIKRNFMKSTIGLLNFFSCGCCCTTGGSCCCPRTIPAGPFFNTPAEVYKQALAISLDCMKKHRFETEKDMQDFILTLTEKKSELTESRKDTGPLTETMEDKYVPLTVKGDTSIKYKKGNCGQF